MNIINLNIYGICNVAVYIYANEGGENLILKKIKKSLTKGGKAGVMRGSLNLRGTA